MDSEEAWRSSENQSSEVEAPQPYNVSFAKMEDFSDSKDSRVSRNYRAGENRTTTLSANTYGDFEAPPNSSLSEYYTDDQFSQNNNILSKKNSIIESVPKGRKFSSRTTDNMLSGLNNSETALRSNLVENNKESSKTGGRVFRTPQRKSQNMSSVEQDVSLSQDKSKGDASLISRRSFIDRQKNYNSQSNTINQEIAPPPSSAENISQEASENNIEAQEIILEEDRSRRSSHLREQKKKQIMLRNPEEDSQEVEDSLKSENKLPSVTDSSAVKETSGDHGTTLEISKSSKNHPSRSELERRLAKQRASGNKLDTVNVGEPKSSERRGRKQRHGATGLMQEVGVAEVADRRGTDIEGVKSTQEQEILHRKSLQTSEKHQAKAPNPLVNNKMLGLPDNEEGSFAVQDAGLNSHTVQSSKQELYSEDPAFNAEESDIYKLSVDQLEGSHVDPHNVHIDEESKDLKEMLEKECISSSRKNKSDEDQVRSLRQIEDSYTMANSALADSNIVSGSMKELAEPLASHNKSDDHNVQESNQVNCISDKQDEPRKTRHGSVLTQEESKSEIANKTDQTDNMRRPSRQDQHSSRNSVKVDANTRKSVIDKKSEIQEDVKAENTHDNDDNNNTLSKSEMSLDKSKNALGSMKELAEPVATQDRSDDCNASENHQISYASDKQSEARKTRHGSVIMHKGNEPDRTNKTKHTDNIRRPSKQHQLSNRDSVNLGAHTRKSVLQKTIEVQEDIKSNDDDNTISKSEISVNSSGIALGSMKEVTEPVINRDRLANRDILEEGEIDDAPNKQSEARRTRHGSALLQKDSESDRVTKTDHPDNIRRLSKQDQLINRNSMSVDANTRKSVLQKQDVIPEDAKVEDENDPVSNSEASLRDSEGTSEPRQELVEFITRDRPADDDILDDHNINYESDKQGEVSKTRQGSVLMQKDNESDKADRTDHADNIRRSSKQDQYSTRNSMNLNTIGKKSILQQQLQNQIREDAEVNNNEDRDNLTVSKSETSLKGSENDVGSMKELAELATMHDRSTDRKVSENDQISYAPDKQDERIKTRHGSLLTHKDSEPDRTSKVDHVDNIRRPSKQDQLSKRESVNIGSSARKSVLQDNDKIQEDLAVGVVIDDVTRPELISEQPFITSTDQSMNKRASLAAKRASKENILKSTAPNRDNVAENLDVINGSNVSVNSSHLKDDIIKQGDEISSQKDLVDMDESSIRESSTYKEAAISANDLSDLEESSLKLNLQQQPSPKEVIISARNLTDRENHARSGEQQQANYIEEIKSSKDIMEPHQDSEFVDEFLQPEEVSVGYIQNVSAVKDKDHSHSSRAIEDTRISTRKFDDNRRTSHDRHNEEGDDDNLFGNGHESPESFSRRNEYNSAYNSSNDHPSIYKRSEDGIEIMSKTNVYNASRRASSKLENRDTPKNRTHVDNDQITKGDLQLHEVGASEYDGSSPLEKTLNEDSQNVQSRDQSIRNEQDQDPEVSQNINDDDVLSHIGKISTGSYTEVSQTSRRVSDAQSLARSVRGSIEDGGLISNELLHRRGTIEKAKKAGLPPLVPEERRQSVSKSQSEGIKDSADSEEDKSSVLRCC